MKIVKYFQLFPPIKFVNTGTRDRAIRVGNSMALNLGRKSIGMRSRKENILSNTTSPTSRSLASGTVRRSSRSAAEYARQPLPSRKPAPTSPWWSCLPTAWSSASCDSPRWACRTAPSSTSPTRRTCRRWCPWRSTTSSGPSASSTTAPTRSASSARSASTWAPGRRSGSWCTARSASSSSGCSTTPPSGAWAAWTRLWRTIRRRRRGRP
mmetsp:Transcript_18257/g.50351  ORF Transcript_18257/g.50351 Transcript_18257/m.50351 type:complete len:210 (+) Transcript_18257:96-725(+)